MKAKKAKGTMKMESKSALRASVGFPPELYRTLEKMAKQKMVSLAWVVREAAENSSRINGRFFKGRGKGDADIL